MRVLLSGVSRFHGATAILSDVSLALPAGARVGVVGPNGVGKSTLLRIAAGIEAPDAGRVEREPASLTVGYLPQQPDPTPSETLLDLIARRTGVASAEDALAAAAAGLAEGGDEADTAYDGALDRFLALGGGDLDRRAAAVARTLGLGVDLDRPRRRPVRRRGGAGRAGQHPALAVRPACARRADERPRLRRPRSSGALPGGLRRRAAGRLARPRVPRPHRRSRDRARPDHAQRPRVRRRLEAYAERRDAEHAAAWARFDLADRRRGI